MKLSDFNKMTKIGDQRRLNERANADGSDAHIEAYKDDQGRYFHLDRKKRYYREIFDTDLKKDPMKWEKLKDE